MSFRLSSKVLGQQKSYPDKSLWRGEKQLPLSFRTTDAAIDLELRNVPLPVGLVERLEKLTGGLRDAATDKVDFRER